MTPKITNTENRAEEGVPNNKVLLSAIHGFVLYCGGRFIYLFSSFFFLVSLLDEETCWGKKRSKPVGRRKFLGFYEAEVLPLLGKPTLFSV